MPADKIRLPPPDISIQGVSKTFDGRAGALAAVGPLSLTLAAGQTTAFVGPSGCGKSTLLRMIAGLESQTAGAIEIGGETPDAVRRRAGLAIAFQDASLLPWRSVVGNIELALHLARRHPDPDAVQRLIELVGLDGFADRRPAELSGGMRQRVAIARCLLTEPDLLLLDEPFGSVDELTRLRLNLDLPRLWETRGMTVVLVTHSISEAVLLSDRVIVFSPRPARVVADLAIPLPRPRNAQTAQTPAYRALVEDVSSWLMAPPAGRPLAAE